MVDERALTPPASEPTGQAKRRLVLLGASNLVRGLAHVIATAQQFWPGPLEIYSAAGLGRSYGRHSTALARQLPGITECGLWPALAARPPAETFALVSDVGNDILYEVPVDQITAWVEVCLGRLRQLGARVILADLPVENLKSLSPGRYLFFRKLLFPNCRLPHAEAIERALELNDRLSALAARESAVRVAHETSWYGFDPIHIRGRLRGTAWPTLLAPWGSEGAPLSRVHTSRWTACRLALGLPEQRRFLGLAQHRTQPALRLAGGTTVSLY